MIAQRPLYGIALVYLAHTRSFRRTASTQMSKAGITTANMSNFEPDSLVSRIEKLELRQQILAKHIIQIKRQLNSCSEQSDNHWLPSLQDALNQLQQQLDERSMQVSLIMAVNEPIEEISCQEKSALTGVGSEELKTDQSFDDFYENSQEPPIDSKEFLSQYKNK